MVEEIRSLRGDLGVMNDRLMALRYQDFQEVFLDQMRSALSEEGRQLFGSDLSTIETASQCERKRDCMRQMQGLILDVSRLLKEDKLLEAEGKLEATEHLILSDRSPCLDDSCAEAALGTIEKAKLLLSLYSNLVGRFSPAARMVKVKESPSLDEITILDRVEKDLGPLANRHRLIILFMLKEGEHNLAEIGRRLDMRSGHLQFHVRSLKEAGYIYADRRRRTYAITPKGTQAIEALRAMIGQLE